MRNFDLKPPIDVEFTDDDSIGELSTIHPDDLDGPIDDEGDGPSGFDFRQDMGDFRIRPFRTS